MAHRGNLPRNPHLQVGSRVTASLLIAILAFVTPSANAESATPTPSPTTSVEASPSPSATPTKKVSPTPTPKVTKKAPAKKITKKKKITPSPKPSWPPKGFSVSGEVYAKVPTSRELVGLISANSYLERQIKECGKFICGAVQVAAVNGCIWWQAIATITNGQGKKLGELTRSFSGSGAKEFKTLLLVSPESLENGGAAKITSVICNHVDRDPAVTTSGYTKFEQGSN